MTEMPSDEDIEKFVKQYEGKGVPNPTNYPKSFMFYWKLFERSNKGVDVVVRDNP